MKRRMLLAVGLAVVLSGQAALAQSFTDSVVDQLRQQGFDRIEVERTLLGRTQIVAQGKGGRREIIFNPRTGEILRDLWDRDSEDHSDRGSLIEDDDDGNGKGRDRGDDDGKIGGGSSAKGGHDDD